jgi:hypothetical protein
MTGVTVDSAVTISGAATDSESKATHVMDEPSLIRPFFQRGSSRSPARSPSRRRKRWGGFAQNIIWVVAGAISINAGAHLEGVLLGKTSIALLTGTTANSRVLAQTVVTLQKVRTSTVTIKLQIDVYSAL